MNELQRFDSHGLLCGSVGVAGILQVSMLKTLLFQYFLEVVFATTLTYGKHTRIDSHIGQQCRTVHAGNLI
jgi:hypothetical protein